MPKHLSPKDRILKERGLLEHSPAPRKHRRLQPATKVSVPVGLKTTLMLYLEQKYGVAIEDVLLSGSLSEVVKKLGDEVDTTTISKWIKRFNLRYSEDNLPNCEGCKQYGPACEVGMCYVLIGLELYELIEAKKKEVLDNVAT